jgi:hypothetical protein
MTQRVPGVLLLLLATGCAHKPLSGGALDRVIRPAFISRIEDEAGPKSHVFRGDSSYGDKLKKLSAKEADRRLAVKLAGGAEDPEGNKVPTINRFQVADTLRSHTLAKLPKERPWTNTARPGDVAAALQSFLVEEVPANAPDYELLRPLGVDAVVEFVVEEYGMRSEGGRAGCYVVGYGRMFMLDGGGNVWFRSFRADQVDSKQPHLDPFKVAKDTTLFRAEMSALLKAVAEVFAKDLNPPDRRGGAPLKEGSHELQEGGDTSTPEKVKKPPEEEDPL